MDLLPKRILSSDIKAKISELVGDSHDSKILFYK